MKIGAEQEIIPTTRGREMVKVKEEVLTIINDIVGYIVDTVDPTKVKFSEICLALTLVRKELGTLEEMTSEQKKICAFMREQELEVGLEDYQDVILDTVEGLTDRECLERWDDLPDELKEEWRRHHVQSPLKG